MWGLCQADQALLSRELLFPCLVLHLAAFCEVLEKEGGLPEHGLRSRKREQAWSQPVAVMGARVWAALWAVGCLCFSAYRDWHGLVLLDSALQSLLLSFQACSPGTLCLCRWL